MRRHTLVAVIAAAAVTVAFAAPVQADTGTSDVYAAIQSVAPEVFDGAAGEEDATLGANALTSAPRDPQIVVPVDPQSGIDISADAETLTIGLPNADRAQDAQSIDPGIVSFDNTDGSSTVPVIKEGGELQIITVIQDASAPQQYEYNLELPEGFHLELISDGRVAVADGTDDLVIGLFDVPWARDANGAAVPTHFTVDGTRLIQSIQHTGAAYPVIADPWWIPALLLVARWTAHALQQQAARGITNAAVKAALQEGRRTAGNQAGTSVFTHNGVRVIVNNSTGAIITVTRVAGGGGGGGGV